MQKLPISRSSPYFYFASKRDGVGLVSQWLLVLSPLRIKQSVSQGTQLLSCIWQHRLAEVRNCNRQSNAFMCSKTKVVVCTSRKSYLGAKRYCYFYYFNIKLKHSKGRKSDLPCPCGDSRFCVTTCARYSCSLRFTKRNFFKNCIYYSGWKKASAL